MTITKLLLDENPYLGTKHFALFNDENNNITYYTEQSDAVNQQTLELNHAQAREQNPNKVKGYVSHNIPHSLYWKWRNEYKASGACHQEEWETFLDDKLAQREFSKLQAVDRKSDAIARREKWF